MMLIKYLRNLAFIVFLLGILVNQAQAKTPRRNLGTLGEFTLRGRIIEVNEEHRFVIINLGSSDGVKKDMIINVFQGGEEAAKLKVSKARRHISACDIQLLYSGRGIAVGDKVIYKHPPIPLIIAKKMMKPFDPTEIIETEPIVVDIDAPKHIILTKSLKVFEEFGVIVTESDLKTYTLKANKGLEMPFHVGLFTERGAIARNRVYYTVEVTATPRYNRLIIRLRGVYDTEGRIYNHEVKKSSSTYREAQTMGFTIKDLSEKL